MASIAFVLLAALTFIATGGRTLIVRSGSMEPVFGAGDVVVTRTISPTDVGVGDVVTFHDPSRNGELVTHRVLDKADQYAGRIAFKTKGDANTGTEEWLIDRDGRLGRFVLAFPRVGYALAWIGAPYVRLFLLLTGTAVLAFAALRRIWGSQRRA